MREHTLAEAQRVRRHDRALAGASSGGRSVAVWCTPPTSTTCSRERPFPALDAYDGCPQHENGIGMARTFEAEVRAALAGDDVAATGPRSGFFAWVDGAPADGYRAPRTTARRSPVRRPLTALGPAA